MKRQVLLSALLAVMLLFAWPYAKAGTTSANDEPEKPAYAFVTGEQIGGVGDFQYINYGITTFDLHNPDERTLLYYINKDSIDQVMAPWRYAILTGAFADDVYYYLDYYQIPTGHKTIGLKSVDLETEQTKIIADYADSNTTYFSMTYDYSTQTMYALDGFDSGYTGLVTVDLETGTKTPACTFSTWDGSYNTSPRFKAIACNYDGEIYALEYWGDFYQIDKETGECTKIARMNYVPSTALMYSQNLVFDHTTGDLYWLVYDFYDWSSVHTIDLFTGQSTRITPDPIKDRAVFTGLHIPFKIAEAGAPAKVENLTLTPGANGATEATLEWDNPTKTFGREGTLEDLTHIDIYRNNEVVHTISNPIIGGHVTWTDTNVLSGLTKYKIVPTNEDGDGEPKSVSAFVGRGVPVAVTNINVVNNGGDAVLTWDASAGGKYDAWIDRSTLVYEITRYPGEVAVITNESKTSYTDAGLDPGKYYYTILAKTTDGDGEMATSDKRVIGSNHTIPYTCDYGTQELFDTWDVIDGNGDGTTWQYGIGFYGLTPYYSALYTYSWNGADADEWLISLPVDFEAGQAYKLTFDVRMSGTSYNEQLAVTKGTGADITTHTEMASFEISSDMPPTPIRIEIDPLSAPESKSIGLHLTTPAGYGYAFRVDDFRIEENHDGNITGKVTSGGNPVEGAKISVSGTDYVTYSDAQGKYDFYFLYQGEYTLEVETFGYFDAQQTATVVELQTVTQNIDINPLPKYTVKGTLHTEEGTTVKNAQVEISGYNMHKVYSEENGTFTINDVYESEDYTITITKNKLETYTTAISTADGNLDLGVVVLNNKLLAPRTIEAEEIDSNSVLVEWTDTPHDAMTFRYDSGIPNNSLGSTNGTANYIFGTIYRIPSTVTEVSWMLTNTVSTHYSVNVFVFDLDEDSNPTNNILYKREYVTTTDNQWSSHTLSAPVEAPRGCYVAISCYGYIGLVMDDGDDDDYPFVYKTHCVASDYTQEGFTYVESLADQLDSYGNFFVRMKAQPYDWDEEDFVPAPGFTPVFVVADTPAMDITLGGLGEIKDTSAMAMEEDSKSGITNFELYRLMEGEESDETTWLLIHTTNNFSYTDNDWTTMPQGVYKYAVKAKYTGDKISPATISELIGKDMLANVTINLNTNTTTNESEGAVVYLSNHDPRYGYDTMIESDNGKAVVSDVWKGTYNISIHLDGFESLLIENVDLSTENAYTLDYLLAEIQITPFNADIWETETADERLFVWNVPDAIFDDFESHEDFTFSSPGSYGWQYIDGDGLETGGMIDYTWEGQFSPMAFVVFNPSATTPSMLADWYYYCAPYSGNKYLADFAAYPGPNNDYVISPRLYYREDFSIKFQARSYLASALETIDVGYSMTGINEEDFIWFNEESLIVPSNWTEYEYTVPAYAKYVTVRSTSEATTIFMLDDLFIGYEDRSAAPGAKVYSLKAPRPEGQYEVYLDGQKLADTDETTYTFSNLLPGGHVAGVRTRYTSGDTGYVSVYFNVDGVGINVTDMAQVQIYPNPATNYIYIKGDYTDAKLFSPQGVQLNNRVDKAGRMDVSNLSSGVYIINIYQNNQVNSHKIIVK